MVLGEGNLSTSNRLGSGTIGGKDMCKHVAFARGTGPMHTVAEFAPRSWPCSFGTMAAGHCEMTGSTGLGWFTLSWIGAPEPQGAGAGVGPFEVQCHLKALFREGYSEKASGRDWA